MEEHGYQAQPDQPAPVLAEQGDVTQAARLQPKAYPLEMSGLGVVILPGGFIRATRDPTLVKALDSSIGRDIPDIDELTLAQVHQWSLLVRARSHASRLLDQQL